MLASVIRCTSPKERLVLVVVSEVSFGKSIPYSASSRLLLITREDVSLGLQ